MIKRVSTRFSRPRQNFAVIWGAPLCLLAVDIVYLRCLCAARNAGFRRKHSTPIAIAISARLSAAVAGGDRLQRAPVGSVNKTPLQCLTATSGSHKNHDQPHTLPAPPLPAPQTFHEPHLRTSPIFTPPAAPAPRARDRGTAAQEKQNRAHARKPPRHTWQRPGAKESGLWRRHVTLRTSLSLTGAPAMVGHDQESGSRAAARAAPPSAAGPRPGRSAHPAKPLPPAPTTAGCALSPRTRLPCHLSPFASSQFAVSAERNFFNFPEFVGVL